jgi:hypothetical protein
LGPAVKNIRRRHFQPHPTCPPCSSFHMWWGSYCDLLSHGLSFHNLLILLLNDAIERGLDQVRRIELLTALHVCPHVFTEVSPTPASVSSRRSSRGTARKGAPGPGDKSQKGIITAF